MHADPFESSASICVYPWLNFFFAIFAASLLRVNPPPSVIDSPGNTQCYDLASIAEKQSPLPARTAQATLSPRLTHGTTPDIDDTNPRRDSANTVRVSRASLHCRA